MRLLPADMHPAQKLWISWARWLAVWHRYEVSGLENLDGPGPTLILGYHGRYIAFDLVILNNEIFERTGRLPVSVMHAYFSENRLLQWFNDGLASVTAGGPDLEKAVADGRHIVVLPGGNREANRSFLTRYKVDWGDRTGYLKLALRHKLRVVPVASSGVDDTYIGLNNGYELGKKLGLENQMPAWAALGPLGLVPFTPSFPAKFRQIVGPPIDLEAEGPVDIKDREQLLRLHRRVVGVMQALVDEAQRTAQAEKEARKKT